MTSKISTASKNSPISKNSYAPKNSQALSYDWLYNTARARFNSAQELEDFLPQAKTSEQLAALGDDRYLSAITQRVFRAGMRHAVVDAKWPAFETAFWNFDPEKLVLLTPEQLDAHLTNAQLIRHRAKMLTIPANAQFILDVRQKAGASFAEFIAQWPVTDIVGLWQFLAKRGKRLGGRSAAGFLRLIGKDTFLTTSDVIGRLQAQGLLEREPRTQKELHNLQAIFNNLHAESGRDLCQLSALISLSINPKF